MHKLSEFNQKRMQELNEIYAGIFSGLQTGVIKLICMNLQNTTIDTTKVFNRFFGCNLGSLGAVNDACVIQVFCIDGDVSLFT